MDTLSRAVRLIDPIAAFLDNRMNPLLVRELRQLVRNRFIVVMLNLYIGVLVFVSLLQVGFSDDINRASGEDLFIALNVVLSVVSLLIVVPYTGLVTATERINDDLMYTSGIRPVSIIFGKFLNGVILSLLLFSVTLPFFTLANQLRGLDAYDAFSLIWLAFLGLHLFNAVVLLVFSAVRNYIQLIIFSGLTLFAGAWCTVAFWQTFHFSNMYGARPSLPIEDSLLFTFFAIMLIAIALAGSVANVAAPTTNRALPFRITVTTAYFLFLAVAWYFQVFRGINGVILAWCVLVLWCLLPLTLLAICERDRLGVRIRATIPKFLTLRMLVFPFYSGAAGALVWVTLLGLGAIGVLSLLSGGGSILPHRHLTLSWDDQLIQAIACSLLFLFDYCVTALLIRSWLCAKTMRHQFTWLLVALLLTVLVVGGMTAYFIMQQQDDFSSWEYEMSVFAAPNPFIAAQYAIGDGGAYSNAQNFCAVFWGIALAPFFLFWFVARLREFSPLAATREVIEEHATMKE